MKKIQFSSSILILILSLMAYLNAHAQAEEDQLSLRLSRIVGYSSGLGDIQGSFKLRASGPENLIRVVFYFDGQEFGEASATPFEFKFNTDNYPMGIHVFTATGFTSDGKELQSNQIQAEFVTAQEGWQAAGRIAIPLLVVLALAMLLSFGISMGTSRKLKSLPLGSPRSYNPMGGTICPKCSRPFAIHLFGLNLLAGRLDRCPYCGKWSLVRRSSPQALRAAELAELDMAGGEAQVPALSEEERLRKEMDDSRYQGL